MKLRFTVYHTSPLPEKLISKDTLGFHAANIDPGNPPDGFFPTKEVTVGELLKCHILTLKRVDYTVKDILESCAYARGAVHLHAPTERDELLFAAENTRVFGQSLPMGALRQIINVVLRGLQPLTDSIAEQLGFKKKQAEGGS